MTLCTILDCDREHDSNGYCSAHWQRWRKGDRGARLTRPLRSYGRKQCNIEGCPNLSHAKGMCQRHYDRWKKGWRGKRLASPIRPRRRNSKAAKESRADQILNRALGIDFTR